MFVAKLPREFLFAAQFAEVTVADELAAFFIPKPIGEGFETGKQGDVFDGLKQRFGIVAFFQMVIGDARAEVVEVMKSDVA